MDKDTIFAIASGAGRAAIAVLRLSGPAKRTRNSGGSRAPVASVRDRPVAACLRAGLWAAPAAPISQNRAGGGGLLRRGVS